MLAAPNAFAIIAAAVTVTEALEVLPVPPSVDETCTLLFFTPAVVPITFTESVQDVLAARVAAPRLTDAAPAAALAVPVQVVVNPLGVATSKPDGRLSVNATPVSGMVLLAGLLMLNVSEVGPFTGIVATPNDFTITGGAATDRLAVAVFPVPPFVEETFPVVLVKLPDAVPVTFTTSVQEA